MENKIKYQCRSQMHPGKIVKGGKGVNFNGEVNHHIKYDCSSVFIELTACLNYASCYNILQRA